MNVLDGSTHLGAATIDSSGTWTFTTPQLLDGTHTFTAVAADTGGNTTTSNAVTAVIDTTPPGAPTISSVTDNVSPVTGAVANGAATNDPNPTVRVNVSGAGALAGDTVQLYDGSIPVGSPHVLTAADIANGFGDVQTGTLAEGTHTITARITDAAGNQGNNSAVFTIIEDTTAPTAGTLSFANLTDTGTANTPPVTQDKAFDLTLTGQESGASVVYQVSTDGGLNWTTTAANQSNLADADYRFRAQVTDAAGNSSTSNVIEVVVDNTVPAAGTLSFANLTDTGTVNTPPVTQDKAFDLTLTGQESGASVVYQVSTDGGLNWTTTAANQSNLADADYRFRAQVTDAAGNSSTSNVIEVVVDNTVPAAGTLSFANLTDTGTANTPPVTQDKAFDLTLTGQESGASVVYQVSTDGGLNWTTTAANLSNLADADYRFRAQVTDAAGNSSTSNVIEVVVDNAVPAEAVAITAITTDTGTVGDFITSDTTLVVSGTNGTLGAGEKVQISSDGTNWFDVTPTDSTHWSYDDTANPHTSSFTYQTRIVDAAGNIGTTASQAVTINTSLPAEAVAITAITTDTGTVGDFITSDTTLVVSGTNGTLGAGEKVQISSDGTNWFDVTPTDSTHWSYDDTANPHFANVTYQVRVIDAASNVGTTASQLVTVDTAAPAAGTLSFANLTDTGTANTPPVTQDKAFDLTLTGQESGASVVYQVSTDGGLNWTTTAANQSNLADADYRFRAQVTDAAGNSSTSNVIEVVVDNTVPAAGTLSFANLTDTGTANTPPVTQDKAFDLTLTGQESGASVVYQVSTDGGLNWTTTAANQSNLADADYRFRAQVTDAAGNSSTSNVIEVVVDNTVPAAGTLSFANLTDTGTANTPPVTQDKAFDLTLTGQESGASVVYQVSTDGGLNWTTTAANLSNLADADYRFRAQVTDAAGNSSTSNVIEVVVDNTVPAAGTLSFANLTDTGTANTPPVTQDKAFDLTLTGQESGASVVYQVSTDGGLNWTTTAANLSNLADADYRFRAQVTDAAGNSSTSNVIEVVVDNTVPAAGTLSFAKQTE